MPHAEDRPLFRSRPWPAPDLTKIAEWHTITRNPIFEMILLRKEKHRAHPGPFATVTRTVRAESARYPTPRRRRMRTPSDEQSDTVSVTRNTGWHRAGAMDEARNGRPSRDWRVSVCSEELDVVGYTPVRSCRAPSIPMRRPLQRKTSV